MSAPGPRKRFVTPGSLPADEDVVRVVRAEEKAVHEALLKGELVYVRAPRKSGKSTLSTRLQHDLPGSGVFVVSIDLGMMLSIEEADHKAAVLDQRQSRAFTRLAEIAGITGEEAAEIRGAAGSAPDWLWTACRSIAERSARRVILLIDEIEEIFAHHRAMAEDWLVSLRRAHNESNGEVTACIFGRLPVSMLVSSAERTPFNTAREVVLPDFTEAQVLEDMATSLGLKRRDLTSFVAYCVFAQTGGQPHLTQVLLKALEESAKDEKRFALTFQGLIRKLVEEHVEFQPSTSNTYMGIDDAFVAEGIWPVDDALAAYRQMLANLAADPDAGRGAILYDAWHDGHRMLEALGLARVERGEDGADDLLVTRNRIAARIFDEDWVKRRERKIPGFRAHRESGGGGSYGEMLQRMEAIAVGELCQSKWAIEHEVKVVPGSGREVVEGALFEFELSRRKPAERLSLQMFLGVGHFGRRLWTPQVRTLRRLSGRSASLPTVYRGALTRDQRIAYIITQRPQYTLIDPLFLDHIRGQPLVALAQFKSLARALELLVEEGITHRNIWPGSIRFDLADEDEGAANYKLSNFEFSVMLRSFVPAQDQSTSQIAAERMAALRRAFLRQSRAARPHAPPEFLQGLFGSEGTSIPALAASDIFSLGMVIAGWFVNVTDPADFESVLIEGEGGSAEYFPDRHAAFLDEVQARISRAVASHRMPAVLRSILQPMLDADPRQRPTAAQLVAALEANRTILLKWGRGRSKPLLACYSYEHTAYQLRDYKLLSSEVGTETNQRDVESFLEVELRGAKLFHAPRGLAPYVDTPIQGHIDAKWVLVGRNWLFYCHPFRRRAGAYGKSSQELPHILRIAYVWPIGSGGRRIPRNLLELGTYDQLTVIEQRSPEIERAREEDYASWVPALREVEKNAVSASFEVAKGAFDWLIEAQRQDILIRTFEIVASAPRDHRGHRAYELDEDAYHRWLRSDDMRSALYQAMGVRRPRDFFEQVFQEAFAQRETAARVRPASSNLWSSAILESVSSAGIVLSGRVLEDRARIELPSISLGERPVTQQQEAVDRLWDEPGLFDQLLQPHIVVTDEMSDPEPVEHAVAPLTGSAREIVRKIVTSSPLIALQGPPGSGKTTIIAAVAQSLLGIDDTQRILITSQSHAAVDNIALRIRDLERAGLFRREVLPVRVAADRQFSEPGRIDSRLQSWRPERRADRLADQVREHCDQRLRSERSPRIRKAYKQLRSAVTENAIELIERVREGANLIFSTTAGTQRLVDDAFLTHGRFDIAIVDEASKAWPTEILQPMLLADRNVLVGDHHQLPAFGASDIKRLLDHSVRSRGEDFRLLRGNQPCVDAWLHLFKSFFEAKNRKFASREEEEQLRGWRDDHRVSDRLNTQYRMRSGIAELISKTFYRGDLVTGESVSERDPPAWIRQFGSEVGAPASGVLWIDTSNDRLFQNATPTMNPGQAELAARLLARAVSLASRSTTGGSHEDAIILSPYRRQNDLISRSLSKLARTGQVDPQIASQVRTVDSFQGQEAELVLLSLARGPIGRDADKENAIRRYGFLIAPERINVMMSRARELLVIIGDLPFFEEAVEVEKRVNRQSSIDLSFWTKLCGHIRLHGNVITQEDLPEELRVR